MAVPSDGALLGGTLSVVGRALGIDDMARPSEGELLEERVSVLGSVLGTDDSMKPSDGAVLGNKELVSMVGAMLSSGGLEGKALGVVDTNELG